MSRSPCASCCNRRQMIQSSVDMRLTLLAYSVSLFCISHFGFSLLPCRVFIHPHSIITRSECLPGPSPKKPTVLCFIFTRMHPRVTVRAPVLKTTRLPSSNRRCCHIRVLHPYLAARSPPLIILLHSPRGMFWLPTLRGHVSQGRQRCDEPFLPPRDSCLRTFLKYLIHYPVVFPPGPNIHSTSGPRFKFLGCRCRF